MAARYTFRVALLALTALGLVGGARSFVSPSAVSAQPAPAQDSDQPVVRFVKNPEMAPPLEGTDLAGKPVDKSNWPGKAVLVNFWATWCPPCVEEMPSLEGLHRALSGEGLVVLGVSIDDDGAALEAFVRRAGVTFPILRDPGARGPAAAWRTTGWPETFILDREGKIVRKIVGPTRWDTPEAISWFRGQLKPGASS